MEKLIILVAGMPGTGKSTIAKFISDKLDIPLISYDNVKSKGYDILEKINNNEIQNGLLDTISYDYFWFFIEELIKSNSSIVADYMFHPSNADYIDLLIRNRKYTVITVLLDCEVRIAYDRFIERNNNQRHPGIAVKDIPYDVFRKGVTPNKNFRYRNNIIFKADNFSSFNKDDVIKEIMKIAKQ